jgi:DNA-binding winged helix-turn-helix (wHTH) protein/tetratricopeptide (TPR) repeat protein
MDQISPGRRPTPAAELAAREPVPLGQATAFPATLELSGADTKVRLEPRMMQVLLLLADPPGRTVSRAELLDRCWGGLIVDDSAINRVIVRLRRAAVEVGGGFAIVTVPRVGYRLEVEASMPAELQTPVDPPTDPSRRRLIGAGVAGAAAVAFAGIVVVRRLRPDARAAEAAELHSRATILLRDMTPQRDAEAIALLREATRIHPEDSKAFGTLALAHQRVAEMGREADAPAAEAHVREAAREALLRDPDNADAQVARLLIMPVYRNWLPAERAYDELLARFPDHVPLLAGHAKLLAEVGRFDDAMAKMDRVFALEPLGPAYHWRRALGLWAAGRPEAALQLAERARRLWPANWSIATTLFWLKAYTGQEEEALALLPALQAQSLPAPVSAFMQRSAVALQRRDPATIQDTLAQNRVSARSNTNLAEQAMAVAAAVGSLDEVFLLASAYHFGTSFTVADARLEHGENMPPRRRKTLPLFWPPMAAARDDPRFSQLTRALGLDAYWTASGRRPDYKLS